MSGYVPVNPSDMYYHFLHSNDFFLINREIADMRILFQGQVHEAQNTRKVLCLICAVSVLGGGGGKPQFFFFKAPRQPMVATDSDGYLVRKLLSKSSRFCTLVLNEIGYVFSNTIWCISFKFLAESCWVLDPFHLLIAVVAFLAKRCYILDSVVKLLHFDPIFAFWSEGFTFWTLLFQVGKLYSVWFFRYWRW